MTSALATDDREVQPDEGAELVSDDLRVDGFDRADIVETFVEGEGASRTRTAVVDLIEEGFGNRRDNHYYSGRLLEAEAEKFKGARMYADHLDPVAERKLGGMPRSVRDLVGQVREAAVTTNDAGKRVIRATCSIAQPWLWNLIEGDPELVGVSINARGASRPGSVQGRRAKLVESITSVRSVDWVSEAGAGGRVIALVESQIAESDDEEQPVSDTAEVADDELAEAKADGKPFPGASKPFKKKDGNGKTSEEKLADEEDPEDTTDGGSDEKSEDDAEAWPDDSGKPWDKKAKGKKKAKAMKESDTDGVDDEDGEPVVEAGAVPGTDFQPTQAWSKGEPSVPDAIPSADKLDRVLGDQRLANRVAEFVEATAQKLAGERLTEAVDAAVAEHEAAYTELIEAERADGDRRVAQTEQRYEAARLIEASGLKHASQAALKAELFDRFFEAEVDDEGDVLREANAVLEDTVADLITAKKQEIGEYSQSRVSGLGGRLTEAAHLGTDTPRPRKPRKAHLDDQLNTFLGIPTAGK